MQSYLPRRDLSNCLNRLIYFCLFCILRPIRLEMCCFKLHSFSFVQRQKRVLALCREAVGSVVALSRTRDGRNHFFCQVNAHFDVFIETRNEKINLFRNHILITNVLGSKKINLIPENAEWKTISVWTANFLVEKKPSEQMDRYLYLSRVWRLKFEITRWAREQL